jgi:rhodanese-related sulfurtransferase
MAHSAAMKEQEPFIRASARQAADEHRWYLVDIRPSEERSGAIGFVPGSRHVATETILADVDAFAASVEKDATVIFVCASGRRSAALAAQLAPRLPQRLGTLEGGTLGWTAAGLPTCGLHPPPPENVPTVPSIEKFPRALLACFAAESIENTLDGRATSELDANAVIRKVLDSACANGVSTRCLETVLERVAEIARRAGFKLPRIRDNIDSFRAAIAALPAR